MLIKNGEFAQLPEISRLREARWVAPGQGWVAPLLTEQDISKFNSRSYLPNQNISRYAKFDELDIDKLWIWQLCEIETGSSDIPRALSRHGSKQTSRSKDA